MEVSNMGPPFVSQMTWVGICGPFSSFEIRKHFLKLNSLLLMKKIMILKHLNIEQSLGRFQQTEAEKGILRLNKLMVDVFDMRKLAIT